jgi:hypothetical protein
VVFVASFLSDFQCPVERCRPAGLFGLEGCRFPVGYFGLKMPAGCAPCFVFEPFQRRSTRQPLFRRQRGGLPVLQALKGGEEGNHVRVCFLVIR